MLSNLNFLNRGQVFPPNDEDTKERLEMYCENEEIWEGDHTEIFQDAFKRIERVIGNFEEVVSFATIINYQKLVSLKTSDLLFVEKPQVTSPQQEEVDNIINENDLFLTLSEGTIDVSRWGNSILLNRIYEGKPHITIIPPHNWFPVVDPMMKKVIKQHVLCVIGEDEEGKILRVEIHQKGSYIKQTMRLIKNNNLDSSYIIGDFIEQPQTIPTNLQDFQVKVLSNITTSSSIFGEDDYRDINSIVVEILVRIAQISRVLDKHASPSVTGPSAALEYDPVSGEYKLKMSNFFPRDDAQQPPVEYITWDGNLESAFKQIELLINQLYVMSQMGAILLGGEKEMGNAPSGTALRLKMTAPLTKARRLANRFENTIKNLIIDAGKQGGKIIENVSIKFQDGLPNDEKEITEIINSRVSQKTMSLKRALMLYDQLSETNADAEIELINSTTEEVVDNTIITPQEENVNNNL